MGQETYKRMYYNRELMKNDEILWFLNFHSITAAILAAILNYAKRSTFWECYHSDWGSTWLPLPNPAINSFRGIAGSLVAVAQSLAIFVIKLY